jgi:hypothetical protein
MSVTIYPASVQDHHMVDGQLMPVYGPVVDFDSMEMFVLKDMPDDQLQEVEDPFRINEKFVPGAGIHMSSGNVWSLFKSLGLDPSENRFDVETVYCAIEEFGHATIKAARSIDEALYLADRISSLRAMIHLARKHNATAIVIAG